MSQDKVKKIQREFIRYITPLLTITCLGILASYGLRGANTKHTKDETFITNDGHYAIKG